MISKTLRGLASALPVISSRVFSARVCILLVWEGRRKRSQHCCPDSVSLTRTGAAYVGRLYGKCQAFDCEKTSRVLNQVVPYSFWVCAVAFNIIVFAPRIGTVSFSPLYGASPTFGKSSSNYSTVRAGYQDAQSRTNSLRYEPQMHTAPPKHNLLQSSSPEHLWHL